MLASSIKQARETCEEALLQPALRNVERAANQNHVTLRYLQTLVESVNEQALTQQPLMKLSAKLLGVTCGAGETAFTRFLLIQGALVSLDRLAKLPLPSTVKVLTCKKIQLFANPEEGWLSQFRIGSAGFVAMCKIATLRRFPAGQLDWEISGLPRSWLLKVHLKNLPQLVRYVATKFGSFGPAFFSHVALHKKNSLLLTEREVYRSYYRMAQCLEIQPNIKGFLTSSWLYSEETLRVSPHLAWLSAIFRENGAIIMNMGPAPHDSGVFTRSPERKALYDAGLFKPTNALVLWGRSEMIKWSSKHPEFGE